MSYSQTQVRKYKVRNLIFRSSNALDNENTISIMHDAMNVIKRETFENDKGLDPRLCKLSITLLLLGVDKTELPLVFQTSRQDIYNHAEFAQERLRSKNYV